MKVLVSGATGNVGRYVVESLLKMGEDVVAAGTSISRLNAEFFDMDCISSVCLNFNDEKTFSKALEGVDRVFLMRPPHIEDPEALLPFIKAIAKKEIRLVAFLSLLGVENNPIPPHHKIEKYLKQYKLPYVFIRPGFFMQNISGIHAYEIRAKNEIFIPAGKSKSSFIDARDIGLAIAAILHSPKQYENTAHNLTGPESLDYYDIADILSEVLGRNIRYVKPSFLKYRREYIKRRGLDEKFVNVTVMLYFMTRMGTAEKVTDDFFKLTGKR